MTGTTSFCSPYPTPCAIPCMPTLLNARLKNPPCMLYTGAVGDNRSTQDRRAASSPRVAECSSKRLNQSHTPLGLHSVMYLITIADNFSFVKVSRWHEAMI